MHSTQVTNVLLNIYIYDYTANIVTSIIFYRICISHARSSLLLSIYDDCHRYHRCHRCLYHCQHYPQICCYRIAVGLITTTSITVAITADISISFAVVVAITIVVAMISIAIVAVGVRKLDTMNEKQVHRRCRLLHNSNLTSS